MKMIKKTLSVLVFILLPNFTTLSYADNNFFKKAEKKYLEKNYEDSKFLFQRNIVFNPKDINSYLYLAKIYNIEENINEEKKKHRYCTLIRSKK